MKLDSTIKIGLVNIDVSHPLAFSEYLAKAGRGQYSAIYNDGFRGDDEVKAFMKKAGIKKQFSNIAELADHVDIGFIQSCNWDNHIDQAQPFIDAGKPVFIDKPIVGNLADCKKLETLADSGAVILGSSSIRYAEEITDFLTQSESERGRILNIFGTAGVDEFNYAIHIVEAIHRLAGSNAVSAKFVGRSEVAGKICETFFIDFANGITAMYNTFHGVWQPCEVVIMTDKTTHQFRIDSGMVYGQLLDSICDYMETGNCSLASVSELTEAIKIMLAAGISKEQGGRAVKLADIQDEDSGYNGNKFEKQYAKTATKIYL